MTWLRKLLAPLVSSDPVAEHRRLVELTEKRLQSTPGISPGVANAK